MRGLHDADGRSRIKENAHIQGNLECARFLSRHHASVKIRKKFFEKIEELFSQVT